MHSISLELGSRMEHEMLAIHELPKGAASVQKSMAGV